MALQISSWHHQLQRLSLRGVREERGRKGRVREGRERKGRVREGRGRKGRVREGRRSWMREEESFLMSYSRLTRTYHDVTEITGGSLLCLSVSLSLSLFPPSLPLPTLSPLISLPPLTSPHPTGSSKSPRTSPSYATL